MNECCQLIGYQPEPPLDQTLCCSNLSPNCPCCESCREGCFAGRCVTYGSMLLLLTSAVGFGLLGLSGLLLHRFDPTNKYLTIDKDSVKNNPLVITGAILGTAAFLSAIALCCANRIGGCFGRIKNFFRC